MKTSKEIYEELRKTYSDEEIAESFVFNDDSMSEDEERKAEREFRELRLHRLKSMSESEIMYGKLMQIKF